MKKSMILYVDDEELNRKMMSRIVGGMGHGFRDAASGPEALEVFRRGGIDLVVSDFNMPGMNGLRLLKELKALDPNVNVMIVSGGLKAGEADALHKAGALTVLDKPLDPWLFKAAVAAALGTEEFVGKEPMVDGIVGAAKNSG
jgi:two-component system NtrC family response regulator